MGLKGVRNLTKLALGLLTHPESEAEILALAQDFTGTAAGSRAGEGGFYACIYPCRAPRKCIREPHIHTHVLLLQQAAHGSGTAAPCYP